MISRIAASGSSLLIFVILFSLFSFYPIGGGGKTMILGSIWIGGIVTYTYGILISIIIDKFVSLMKLGKISHYIRLFGYVLCGSLFWPALVVFANFVSNSEWFYTLVGAMIAFLYWSCLRLFNTKSRSIIFAIISPLLVVSIYWIVAHFD